MIEAATGTAAAGAGYFPGAELANTSVPVSSSQIYCVDYTIHQNNGSNPDTGFVEFAILVKKTSLSNSNNANPGNLEIVGIMPTVYYSQTGVLIPPGATPTSFAQPYLVTNPVFAGATADADDGMIKGNLVSGGNGFSFTFTAGGNLITVDGFTPSNNPKATGVCTNNCDLASTFSTTVNFLDGNNDGTLSPPIGSGEIGPVPEIDGARLPQAVLLLSTLYLLVFRRRQHNLVAARA